VSGPEGALKVWGVKSRLMGGSSVLLGGVASKSVSILMENRQDAYPLSDKTPVTLDLMFLSPRT
jgi:hypothetical protein